MPETIQVELVAHIEDVLLELPDGTLIPGEKGDKGDPGEKGDKGDPGEQGPPGDKDYADIRDFGGVAGGPDTTQPFLDALAWMAANGETDLHFPRGRFDFLTPLPPIEGAPRIIGKSKSKTVLSKRFGGNFFHFTGLNNEDGGLIKDLSIHADAGAQGTAIVFEGDATEQPDFWHVDNVGISGPALWTMGVKIDGIARTALQGVRACRFRDMDIWNCTVASMWIRNGQSTDIHGCVGYQGAGVLSAAGFYVTGGLAENQKSNTTVFTACRAEGQINLTNSYNTRWYGLAPPAVNVSNATYQIYG